VILPSAASVNTSATSFCKTNSAASPCDANHPECRQPMGSAFSAGVACPTRDTDHFVRLNAAPACKGQSS
jgi:hypothetical protein